MRLNNHGLGYGQFFWTVALLLFLLFLAFVNLNHIGNSLKKEDASTINDKPGTTINVPISYYHSLENSLKLGAIEYVEDIYSGETFISKRLTYIVIKNAGLVDTIKDGKDNTECTGYVDISGNFFKPYIKCSNYETEGY